MLPEDEKLIRLRRQRSKEAITLAMQGRWREAVAANKEIIENFAGDVDAYNRLGRAYLELGEYELAEGAYRRALELDAYNAIAKKNLQRLSYLKGTSVSPEVESHKVEPQHFIEEMGKTGVVKLFTLAPKAVLARAVAGDTVYLKIDEPSLTAEDGRGEYLGQVDPRYSQRLIKLMQGGNKYSAVVVSSSEDSMMVMVREVYQHPSQAGQLSFPPRGLEEIRHYGGDRILKLEEREEEPEEPGYTIIGGEGMEVLPEGTVETGDEVSEEE